MGRGRRPKFTQEQEQAIARRYETGNESMSAIAETLGTTRGLIGEILNRQKVETRHHQHALTPMQEEEVVKLFVDGSTGRDLQALFGVDQTTITRIVRERGGPLRRCGRKRVFETRKEWLESPRIRMRKLLHTARANERGHVFDDALLDIFPNDPPKQCACCDAALDYGVYARDDMSRDRSPSLDRCDNTVGYVVGNVYIVCFRCNRLKSSASLQELRYMLAYVERHFCGKT